MNVTKDNNVISVGFIQVFHPQSFNKTINKSVGYICDLKTKSYNIFNEICKLSGYDNFKSFKLFSNIFRNSCFLVKKDGKSIKL